MMECFIGLLLKESKLNMKKIEKIIDLVIKQSEGIMSFSYHSREENDKFDDFEFEFTSEKELRKRLISFFKKYIEANGFLTVRFKLKTDVVFEASLSISNPKDKTEVIVGSEDYVLFEPKNTLAMIYIAIGLYDLLSPYYGHFYTENYSGSDFPLDTDIKNGRVNRIYPVNFFGPDVVKKIGNDKIKKLENLWMIKELKDGGFLIVLESNPINSEKIWDLETDVARVLEIKD